MPRTARSTQRYASMVWRIVLYLTGPPHHGILYVTYPQEVTRVHTIGHTNRDWCMYYEYTSGNAVRYSTIQYTTRPLHTVLQVPQLGTLGITAPHNSTYPEYSWLVLCVVLCYAVGVLCSVLLVALYATMYYTL